MEAGTCDDNKIVDEYVREYEDLGTSNLRDAARESHRSDEQAIADYESEGSAVASRKNATNWDRRGSKTSVASSAQKVTLKLKLTAIEAEVDASQIDAGVLAELDELRSENEKLRQQVTELQSQVDTFGGSWLGQFKGPGALLHAPIDLWIVYTIKIAECSAYFGFSYVFVEYLSDEFNMDDQEAGAIYALYGLLCTVVGLPAGAIIDYLGVRKSLMIGTVGCTIYRGICAVSKSKVIIWIATMTWAPVGAAFGVPVMALAVRRYSHRDNRTYAFSLFYTMLTLGVLLGSAMINVIRDLISVDVPTDIMGYPVGWMRMVALVSTALTAYTAVASYFVRDIQVLSDAPLRDKEFCEFKPQPFNLLQAAKEIASKKKFRRVAGVTMIFCGVRMTFRHLDATFPKYMMRTYGPDAPFELFLAINPLAEMIGTPIMSGILLNKGWTLSQHFHWGSLVTGLSVFALAIWESYFGCIVFILAISFGDTLWCAKLYEFSTMAADEGKEGMYLAITLAPMYLASVPVGVLSGFLLKTFVPKNKPVEEHDGKMMWFLIGLSAFISPVLLFLFRKKLFSPEDDAAMKATEKPEEGEGERHKPGKHRLKNIYLDDSDDDRDNPSKNKERIDREPEVVAIGRGSGEDLDLDFDEDALNQLDDDAAFLKNRM